jgi:hypothetical protein
MANCARLLLDGKASPDLANASKAVRGVACRRPSSPHLGHIVALCARLR